MSVLKYYVVSLSKHTFRWSISFSPGNWEPSRGLEPLQGHREHWRRRSAPQPGRSVGGSCPESSHRSRAAGPQGCWESALRLTRCSPSTPDEEPVIGRRWGEEAGRGGRTEGGEICCSRTQEISEWVSSCQDHITPFFLPNPEGDAVSMATTGCIISLLMDLHCCPCPGFITEL